MAINNTVENINNQPTIQPQTVTGAFLRYIAKTIPLAFDESMSYYECICALRDYINQFIDNLNNVNEGLSELQTFYLELQDYVNTYFDNLDVQEEINKKLDEMAEDGSLTNLIKDYVDPIYQEYETSINNHISNYESGVNQQISTLSYKVNTATSGSPLVASSTAGMTDTTRIYVNTTDGKWYYYDGDSWEIGGTYLSNDADTTALAEEQLGNKYTEFTTASTSTTIKNIMVPASMKAGDTVEIDLISTSANITKYTATAWTSDSNYKVIQSNLLKNEKVILTIPNDYSEYNRMQMYIYTTDTVNDTDINPYVYVYGELKEESYNNSKTIITNTSDINNLKQEYTEQYGTYKTNWTRVYNTSISSIFLDTIDEIPENSIVSFNIETTEEASNIQAYTLTFYDSNDQYTNVTGLHVNTVNEIVCPRDTIKLAINITTLTELDPTKVVMTLNVYGNTNTKIYELENQIDGSSLYNSKILVMGDSISTDSYGSYKKWVTDLIEDSTFNGNKVTNSSYHATGFVATYQEGGVVVSDTFYNRLSAISNKSSYDLVITFGGINDYIQDVAWSDFTTAVDTYLEYLVKNFTQAKLVIISPLRTYNPWPNHIGKYQTEYDEYIRNKAKYYCLPVLNLTEESGFCPFIDEFKNMWTIIPAGYEVHDGVHPNADYQKQFLAPMIKKFINNLYEK